MTTPAKSFRSFAIVIFFVAIAAALGFYAAWHNSSSGGAGGSEQLYTCGMHPQVIQNKPGLCPICGMKLTPLRKQPGPGADAGKAAAPDDNTISVDPVTIQNMDIRTALVTKGPLKRKVRTVGVVDFDETTLADVTTKFKGWIEKLYVDSTGQQVHKGEPLFEVYSPDLYSAQTEYLLVLNQPAHSASDGSDGLKDSARSKLKYFDVSDEQIAELEKTRQAQKTVRFNAPRDGVVVEKMVVAGQMVDAGMKLYRLADLAVVWVQSQIYEQDLPFVQLGQDAVVSLSYLPDRKFRGRVTYVYPTVDDKTRTARVRMEFHNPGFFLKPGMFATVELQAELDPAAILVPDSAVLRSGERNTVFIALDGGRFEPRTIMPGQRSENDFYQVLSGLKEGERVVTSGQFMLDSESQLREAIQKMMKPGAAGEQPESPGVTPTNTSTSPGEPKTYICVCPMSEHLAIQYDHPGKCPICGMDLMEASPELLAKLQPGARILYFTCPMPEHSDVKLDHPGKCPKCGMTLVPVTEIPSPVKTNGPAPMAAPHAM